VRKGKHVTRVRRGCVRRRDVYMKLGALGSGREGGDHKTPSGTRFPFKSSGKFQTEFSRKYAK